MTEKLYGLGGVMSVGFHSLGGDVRMHEGMFVKYRPFASGAEEDDSFLDRYL